VVGGGYYVYVLVVFYRKEIWNYVSGKKVQPSGERAMNGRSSGPGSNSDKAPGDRSDRSSGVVSGKAADKYLPKRPDATVIGFSGRPFTERPVSGGLVKGLGSPAVRGWQVIQSGSEDAMRRRSADYQDVDREQDDPDDLTNGDVIALSRREEKSDDEWWYRLEEEGQEVEFTGPVGKEGTQEEQRDMLFRAMGTVIIQLKEVVRQAKEGGTDRESLTNQLSEVLRKYGQLKGTSYQAGINNFLTRTCSTNFSLLLGADELEVMWN
jgi:hypothetical protein